MEMYLIEALKTLRDDIKLWTANNLKTKVTKEKGKRLTTNDFTNYYKKKIDSIEDTIYPVGTVVIFGSDYEFSFSFGVWDIVKEDEDFIYYRRSK